MLAMRDDVSIARSTHASGSQHWITDRIANACEKSPRTIAHRTKLEATSTVDDLETNPQEHAREEILGDFRPLDRADVIGPQVFVQADPEGLGRAPDAPQIEVEKRR